MASNTFAYDPLEFGTILNDLLLQETVTNINCWYGRLIVSDNKQGQFLYNIDSYDEKEKEEYYDTILKLSNRLANRMVVSYNEGSPILDAETEFSNIGRLRINAIHPSLNGSNYPAISIRKALMKVRINKKSMMSSGYATEEIINLLAALIEGGNNTMISGITGSGKTELLKYIARYIKDNEGIITIEDTREAYLEENYPDKFVLALKSSEGNSFSDLIRTSLRQNPNWICVSETRSEEVLDLLSATETGHNLLSTIHSSSARAIPNRMVSMAKARDGSEANRIYRQVYENIDIGVHISYTVDESGLHRMIDEICEFYIDDLDNPKAHMICRYDLENNRYIYNKIESTKIRENLIRKKINTNRLKGVFLNA